jgi:glycosyltransferase involved in cell wall biosynthesis
MDRSLPAVPTGFAAENADNPVVSVIVPARNEEANLGECLASLTSQSGVAFEIIVVDDASTDRTRGIAEGFSSVRVISAGSPPMGWTGKNNAVAVGAREARGNWLLFTDADTVHLQSSLSNAVGEATEAKADLLSYSPGQVVVTFAERAVMPVVFAALAAQYPPQKVRDQDPGIVAANGQYILVRRAAYESVGGHVALATEILEDVALARLFRKAGLRVYFRYGADAVRTRMYRNWTQLREGWTKNLALLFPHPWRLVLQSLFFWSAAWLATGIAVFGPSPGLRLSVWLAAVALWMLLYLRIRIAHFGAFNNLIAMTCGVPAFCYLLLRSVRAYAMGHVSWKGREYRTTTDDGNRGEGREEVEAILPIENRTLRTEKLRTGN